MTQLKTSVGTGEKEYGYNRKRQIVLFLITELDLAGLEVDLDLVAALGGLEVVLALALDLALDLDLALGMALEVVLDSAGYWQLKGRVMRKNRKFLKEIGTSSSLSGSFLF